jgi:hypothetical protein
VGVDSVRAVDAAAVALAGDRDAADRVQLPETGACRATPAPEDTETAKSVAGFGFGTGSAHGYAGDLLAVAGSR